MFLDTFWGVLLPFIGTVLGAGCVFFLKDSLNKTVNKILLGFAGGVMIAASVWSLIIPAVNFSENMGFLSFVPVTVGIWIGILFIISLNMNYSPDDNKVGMFFWAVLLHNIPEGMAVGVVYASLIFGSGDASLMSAFLLSLGISIQNFPEGAIISLPLASNGMSRKKAFAYGAVSGIVEPLGALLAILAVSVVSALLPYVLGFAAGAMIYVVLEEIMPEILKGNKCIFGKISFALGFTVMMILDIVLS